MVRSLALFALLALATTASAAQNATEPLPLPAPFVLNGTELAPGNYRIAVSPSLDTVDFILDRKTVATAPCKVTLADLSVIRDEVHSRPDGHGREQITRLVLWRPRMSIEILQPATVAAAGAAPTATETR